MPKSVTRNFRLKKYYTENEEQRDKPLLFENCYNGDLQNDLQMSSIPADISEHALRCVLGDAILRATENTWVSYSLNANKYIGASRYGGQDFTRVKVKNATEYAESLGLIRIDAGKSWKDGGFGKQSRFRGTSTLLYVAGVSPPIIKKSNELIRLKNEKYALIDYDDTDYTNQLRHELLEWNEHIGQFRIWVDDPRVNWQSSGVLEISSLREKGGHFFVRPDSVAMHRVFNNNSFELGGRAFGPFWQSLPKSIRANLRVGDARTASGDYSCSHLRLAYAEAEIDPGSEDGYAINGYEAPEQRQLIKIAVNIAINCTNAIQATRALSDEIAWLKHGDLGPQKNNTNYKDAVKMFEAIFEKHERIRKVFFTGSGLRLMAHEASILSDVAKTARKRGIVTLPVHDELISEVQHVGIVKDLMIEKWSDSVPVKPIVK